MSTWKHQRKRFLHFSFDSLRLRSKLLLISLVVLAIPWAGLQFVREMEGFLRIGLEQTLLATADAVATVLHEQPELFESHGNVVRPAQDEKGLYAQPLETPIILDGHDGDWNNYRNETREYGAANLLLNSGQWSPESLSFDQVLGGFRGYLYTYLRVTDDHVVYRDRDSLRLDQSDHIELVLKDPQNQIRRYLLTTHRPGWVNAHLMPTDPANHRPLHPEIQIKGEWRETEAGYDLEIRIPLSMVGSQLAFAVGDVDDPDTRELHAKVATSVGGDKSGLSNVLVPSPPIERLLKSLSHSASRLWVVDDQSRVLALAGTLEKREEDYLPEEQRGWLSRQLEKLYTLILHQPKQDFGEEELSVTSLQGSEVEEALAGRASTRWRPTDTEGTAILAAAHPVYAGDRVIGAVVAEQTSNPILTLQNRALEKLFNVTLVVFLAAGLVLLAFASRLSLRIRRLRNEAEHAIGPDGRLQGSIKIPRATDELGDLARSFSHLIDRVGQYTRYLENMADKLSHELRTPLAVVRSSLENMEMGPIPDEAARYSKRAREGVDRLTSILASMSEASRLEQILQRSDQEDFDLAEVVSGCVEGYRIVYTDKTFKLTVRQPPIPMNGVPDLIAQMLDKLVSNAVDFSSGPDPIVLRLRKDPTHAYLSIIDTGAPLPKEMQERLFESMVSMRTERSTEAHLGMGLYIVRLIVEFHGGRVRATNRANIKGAEFTIILPLRKGAEA